MPRTIGRRAMFFAALAAISAALVPFSPSEFRWVAWFSAGLAALWAAALALEDLTTPGGIAPRAPRSPAPSPFDPPPPPGGAS